MNYGTIVGDAVGDGVGVGFGGSSGSAVGRVVGVGDGVCFLVGVAVGTGAVETTRSEELPPPLTLRIPPTRKTEIIEINMIFLDISTSCLHSVSVLL